MLKQESRPDFESEGIETMDLSIGKKVRLHRLLFQRGPRNGRLLLMPFDQGMEHGPRDFFHNPASEDPSYVLDLAEAANFSGIVMGIGLASKYMHRFAGKIPLIVKINGKTDIPSDETAFSPQTATVEEAVSLGADAVGYTLYVGSPAQDRDFVQFMGVREKANQLGIPIVVWAYPRGAAVQQKGGRESLYAIGYAARVAAELGADVIKVNMPDVGRGSDSTPPKPYDTLELSPEEALRRVILSAGKSLVILSGGEISSDDELIQKAQSALAAGASGFIFGRNVWQRPYDEALQIVGRLHEMLAMESA